LLTKKIFPELSC